MNCATLLLAVSDVMLLKVFKLRTRYSGSPVLCSKSFKLYLICSLTVSYKHYKVTQNWADSVCVNIWNDRRFFSSHRTREVSLNCFVKAHGPMNYRSKVIRLPKGSTNIRISGICSFRPLMRFLENASNKRYISELDYIAHAVKLIDPPGREGHIRKC